MNLNCIIYTTESIKPVRRACEIAQKYLLKTKGREDVQFTIVKVTKPTVQTRIDSEGDVRINWDSPVFKAPIEHNVVGFHFNQAKKRRWKIAHHINGSSNAYGEYMKFWACADDTKSRHYSYPELTRLIIHEISHGDVRWTGDDPALVHYFDYYKHAIHELPAQLSYEQWNALTALRDQLKEQFKKLYGKIAHNQADTVK
jgi:hypothetical protein